MKIPVALLTILLCALQFKLWLSPSGMIETWRLSHAIQAQRYENSQLVGRNAALEAEVVDLKIGHAAIEESARSEAAMVKQDEAFYQIVSAQG